MDGQVASHRAPRESPARAGGRAYRAPAADKALDILELLAARGAPLSGAEIARALGRSAGEIFRPLVLLERRGYVARQPGDGRYALTLRLHMLARKQDPFGALLAAARAPMDALAETVRESCHLGVVRHGRLLIAARAEAPRPIRLAIQLGASFPVAETTSGRLIAAQLPEAARAALLGTPPPGLPATAAEGWLCEPSLVHAGVTNLSVLLDLPEEKAALTISWIAPAGAEEDRRAALLAAARNCGTAIRAALGLGTP